MWFSGRDLRPLCRNSAFLSTGWQDTMPRAPSPSIPEKEFVYSILKQSLRLDGRLALEMRTPELTFGAELGWVECVMGKTRLVTYLYRIGIFTTHVGPGYSPRWMARWSNRRRSGRSRA